MESNKIDIELGKKINQLRDEHKETQPQLQKVMGLAHRETINQWESGERKVKAEYLVKLSKHYNVSVDWLLGLSKYKTIKASVKSATKTTGLDENAVRRMALEALTGEKSPMLQALDLLLTTRSGIEFLHDLYRYAIAEYDKFTCKQGDKEINLDSVSLNGEPLDIAKMGFAFMTQVQDDLFRLKDEYDGMKEEKRNG